MCQALSYLQDVCGTCSSVNKYKEKDGGKGYLSVFSLASDLSVRSGFNTDSYLDFH